ncbi:hypothetical protein [Leucobacter soli]|uniref:hypothetical protein n=1 Tax=Leucobacter soli TaxID=2812850 RepID=UPI003615B9B0
MSSGGADTGIGRRGTDGAGSDGIGSDDAGTDDAGTHVDDLEDETIVVADATVAVVRSDPARSTRVAAGAGEGADDLSGSGSDDDIDSDATVLVPGIDRGDERGVLPGGRYAKRASAAPVPGLAVESVVEPAAEFGAEFGAEPVAGSTENADPDSAAGVPGDATADATADSIADSIADSTAERHRVSTAVRDAEGFGLDPRRRISPPPGRAPWEKSPAPEPGLHPRSPVRYAPRSARATGVDHGSDEIERRIGAPRRRPRSRCGRGARRCPLWSAASVVRARSR